MPGKEHSIITDLACQLLPDWQQQALAPERQRLRETWCKLPDLWMGFGDSYELANPYYYETEGIQFHYLPDTPIDTLYRYYARDPQRRRLRLLQPYDNPNWIHARNGFTYYLRQAVDACQDQRLDDACAFTGWLLHMLQDYSFGGHALEGPYGTDFFVLQRLFPQTDDPALNPVVILGESTPPPAVDTLGAYEPRLLGLEPEEMAIHLYARHVLVNTQARRLCHQIVVNAYEDRRELNQALFDRMYEHAIYLSMDVLYTVLACGAHRFDHPRPHLRRPMLSDFEPIQRPWLVAPPYRNHAIIRDAAMNCQRQRIPLALRLQPDADPTTYTKGLGFGTHHQIVLAWELPRDLYTRLTGYLGLNAQVADCGQAQVTVLQDDRTVGEWQLHPQQPTIELDLEDPGGVLTFVIETERGLTDPHNHLVLAEPALHRREMDPA